MKRSKIVTISLLSLFLYFTNHSLFFLINGNHQPSLDKFFSTLSFCGDGLVLCLLVACLSAYYEEYAIAGFFSLIASGAMVQFLKYLFPSPRPPALLTHVQVIGQRLRFESFPSGHTASAFAVGFLFYYLFRQREQKLLGYLSLIAAALVGYARIYIGVHFPVDVAVGGIIGYLFTRFSCNRLNYLQEWLDRQSEEKRLFIRRTGLGLLVTGGLVLGFFYSQVPEQETTTAIVFGLSAVMYGIYHLHPK